MKVASTYQWRNVSAVLFFVIYRRSSNFDHRPSIDAAPLVFFDTYRKGANGVDGEFVLLIVTHLDGVDQ